MIRAEASPENLIVTYLDQFGDVGEWNGIIRLKWILNSSASSQIDSDHLVVLAMREKNKTL